MASEDDSQGDDRGEERRRRRGPKRRNGGDDNQDSDTDNRRRRSSSTSGVLPIPDVDLPDPAGLTRLEGFSVPTAAGSGAIRRTVLRSLFVFGVLGMTLGFVGYALTAYAGGSATGGQVASSFVGLGVLTAVSVLGPVVALGLGVIADTGAGSTPAVAFGVAAANGLFGQTLLYLFVVPLLVLQGGVGALDLAFVLPALFVATQTAVASVAGTYVSIERGRSDSEAAVPTPGPLN